MARRWYAQSSARNHPALLLLVGMIFLACSLPGKLVESFPLPVGRQTLTPTISPSATEEISLTDTLSPTETALASELPTLEAAVSEYPVPATSRTSLSSGTPSTPDNEKTRAFTGLTVSPTTLHASGTPSPSPSLTGLPYPQQFLEGTPYPGGQPINPTIDTNPYPPGASTQITSNEPYPAGTNTLNPVLTPSAQPTSSLRPTFRGTLPAGFPIPTARFIIPTTPMQTASSGQTELAPTATFFFPSATPTPTRTPYLTPTPTMTHTPTPTRTPLPAPPWMNVQIQASDPSAVMLVSGRPQLIEFFAYWNGACLAMAPIVKGLEEEYSGRVNFIYIDIDDPETDLLKRQLHYRTEPHFVLLDGRGNMINEWLGYVSVDQFRLAISSALE